MPSAICVPDLIKRWGTGPSSYIYLGKILTLFGNEPQWNVVGDTFPVGCKFSNKIVYNYYFKDNPDNNDIRYSSQYGIYEKQCGLDNVLFSFGHDEYLYKVCKFNKCKIPEIGLRIIRYHSFYAWHKEGDYKYLTNQDDDILLEMMQIFNKADLYTKNDDEIKLDLVKTYYDDLIKKYFVSDKIHF